MGSRGVSKDYHRAGLDAVGPGAGDDEGDSKSNADEQKPAAAGTVEA